jgi:hypothetical protein
MSGRVAEVISDAGVLIPADAFLAKPFTAERLLCCPAGTRTKSSLVRTENPPASSRPALSQRGRSKSYAFCRVGTESEVFPVFLSGWANRWPELLSNSVRRGRYFLAAQARPGDQGAHAPPRRELDSPSSAPRRAASRKTSGSRGVAPPLFKIRTLIPRAPSPASFVTSPSSLARSSHMSWT